ncbi:HK97 family phage prohead protease [Mesorhizobium abyssinicae]
MADHSISGYAVVYNSVTDIGGSFREKISPGPF